MDSLRSFLKADSDVILIVLFCGDCCGLLSFLPPFLKFSPTSLSVALSFSSY